MHSSSILGISRIKYCVVRGICHRDADKSATMIFLHTFSSTEYLRPEFLECINSPQRIMVPPSNWRWHLQSMYYTPLNFVNIKIGFSFSVCIYLIWVAEYRLPCILQFYFFSLLQRILTRSFALLGVHSRVQRSIWRDSKIFSSFIVNVSIFLKSVYEEIKSRAVAQHELV